MANSKGGLENIKSDSPIFLKKQSMFSGNKGMFGKNPSQPRFVAPKFRITQNKGGGGK